MLLLKEIINCQQQQILSCFILVYIFYFMISPVEYKVIGPSMPVTAEEKDDVVLRCHVEPELDVTNETVEWKLQDNLVHRYRSRDDDLDFQDPKFKGRTSLFRKEMVQGNVSLKLTNITQEDAGNYTCKVLKLKAQVTLNVGEFCSFKADKPRKIHLILVMLKVRDKLSLDFI